MGRLSYEMWRACRLVIDTGIHAFGWTRERAMGYLRDRAALSKHEIITNIDRYIAWRGQALAYKLGELQIRHRREAEEKLGAKFDQRRFHDTIPVIVRSRCPSSRSTSPGSSPPSWRTRPNRNARNLSAIALVSSLQAWC